MVLEFTRWMFINLMVALGLVFLATYSRIFRSEVEGQGFAWRETGAFATMAIFCMQFPWVMAPGVRMDLRMVALGLAGLYHGWRSALVVGLVIAVVRIWIGGAGVIPGIIYASFCVASIPFFRGRSAYTLAKVGIVYVIGLYLVVILMLDVPGMGATSPLWLLNGLSVIIGFVLINGAVEYVSEKWLLQQSLAMELESKAAVLELIPYGILLVDARWRVTGSNQAGRAFVQGDHIPVDFLNHCSLEPAMREKRSVSGCRITYQPGTPSERILILSATPLEGGGAIVGLHNVTSLVHQEREAAHRSRLEVLGQLAAMAAHEIKNPLTTIKGFLQLYATRPEFKAEQSTFRIVEGEVERINRVVGDFLHLAAQRSFESAAVDIDLHLLEVVDSMDWQFSGQGIRLHMEGTEGLCAWADAKAVRQILKNLLTNAVEAMESGGQLTLCRERTNDGITISVLDSGPGIPPESLPLLFTPFMTTKQTGTGLGLVISQKLATEMGGSLTADTIAGQGCAFRLMLPAQPEAVGANAQLDQANAG